MRFLTFASLSVALLAIVATGFVLASRAGNAAVGPDQPDPRVDVQHYAFHLGLNDENDVIEGDASIELLVTADTVASVTLNLVARDGDHGMVVSRVTGQLGDVADGSDGGSKDGAAIDLEFSHEGDRLTIALPGTGGAGSSGGDGGGVRGDTGISALRYLIRVEYSGVPGDGLIISKNKYGDRTFFGDNWPNRARHWLPTVDHPSDKATVEFVVDAPDHYQVVATGAVVEESDLGDGRRRTHTRSVVPIATKVMVIGVARFAVDQVRVVDGIPVSSWVYPQDREAGFYDYALAAGILDYFASHIGPFPYLKLANVQSKTRYGGMENAGNIFYSEGSVSGNRNSEGLLAHEIAHQWFGDSVTEDDWHHVWLSEGFATYFTQLYFEHTYGRDRMNDGLRAQRSAVVAHHKGNPDSPVVDTTITNLNALLSTNSYQKGGWVLHMLRREVGDEAFWEGISSYYREHRDDNALTSDLRRAMEQASGKLLAWFFDQWVHRPGQPEIRVTWSVADGGAAGSSATIDVTVEQLQDGGPFRFPLDVGFQTTNAESEVRTFAITQQRETFRTTVAQAPNGAVLDPNVWLLMKGSIERK